MSPKHVEGAIQAAFADLLRLGAGSRVWWHSIPNEGLPGPILARLTKQGMRAGVPDFLLFWVSDEWVELPQPVLAYIEFKRPGEKPGRRQMAVHDEIRTAGGLVLVHTDAMDAYRNVQALGAPLARVLEGDRLVPRRGGAAGEVAPALGWERVMFASECDPDGDGWCRVRDCDVGECDCIGPTEDDVEYREIGGVLHGRRIKP